MSSRKLLCLAVFFFACLRDVRPAPAREPRSAPPRVDFAQSSIPPATILLDPRGPDFEGSEQVRPNRAHLTLWGPGLYLPRAQRDRALEGSLLDRTGLRGRAFRTQDLPADGEPLPTSIVLPPSWDAPAVGFFLRPATPTPELERYPYRNAYIETGWAVRTPPGNDVAVPARGFPFRGGRDLAVEWEMQIPTVEVGPDETAYVEFDVLWRDTRSGLRFGLIVRAFSSDYQADGSDLGAALDEFCSTCTGSLWMTAIIRADARWIRLAPGSAEIGNQAWRGWRRFAFVLSHERMAEMLRAAIDHALESPLENLIPFRALSPDPGDYRYDLTTLGIEFVHPEGLHSPTSAIGASMRGLSLVSRPREPGS